MANDLFERPAFHLPLFEQAAIDAAVSMSIFDEVEEEHDPIQITLSSSRNPITIRQLLSTKVTKVVTAEPSASALSKCPTCSTKTSTPPVRSKSS